MSEEELKNNIRRIEQYMCGVVLAKEAILEALKRVDDDLFDERDTFITKLDTLERNKK